MTKINRSLLVGYVRMENMYAVEVDDQILYAIWVECPDNELLGIDVVIPDFSYLTEKLTELPESSKSRPCGCSRSLTLFSCGSSVPFWFGIDDCNGRSSCSMTAKPRSLKTFMLLMKSRSLTLMSVFFKTTHSIPGSLGIDIENQRRPDCYTMTSV